MSPASHPRSARHLRLLVVGRRDGDLSITTSARLPSLFAPGDLLVVNDAATLPAGIFATLRGEPIEIRLATPTLDPQRFVAVLFGRGDYRTRTEDRPPPPRLAVGDVLVAAGDLRAEIIALRAESKARLVELRFSGNADDVLPAIYRAGHPVQYAHVPQPLALWDVQNLWAGPPWAVEMPSAGRILSAETLVSLRERGVGVASVTHAAGLSSTGDAALDACLPLPERWRVPEATTKAIAAAHAKGGRVVAVGTSVVRALETAARTGETEGVTDLRLGPTTPRRVVDGLLTGVHDAGTSHFSLLGAFAPRAALDEALRMSERAGFLSHELGDEWLVWGNTASAA